MLGYGWEFQPNIIVQGQSLSALAGRTGTRFYLTVGTGSRKCKRNPTDTTGECVDLVGWIGWGGGWLWEVWLGCLH